MTRYVRKLLLRWSFTRWEPYGVEFDQEADSFVITEQARMTWVGALVGTPRLSRWFPELIGEELVVRTN